MKVALVTHEFPPSIFGGIGIFAETLAHTLAKRGLEIIVVAGSADKHPQLIRMARMKVIRLPRGNIPPRHLWFQLRNMNVIAKELATCDVIHGQDVAAFPLLNFCRRIGLKVPWVVTFHTNPLAQLQLTLASIRKGWSPTDFATYVGGFPLWDLTIRSLARHADRLVSVSRSLREELCTAYGIERRRMQVVHTGIDISQLRTRTNIEVGSSLRNIDLLYAGRLYYGKGILHLLNIIHFIKRDIAASNFHLQVFGKGPLEDTLRRYVSRSKLDQLVTFRGHVPHDRMLVHMSNCDIVCLPSLYEACPMLMIEAMALAKPVIAFDLPFSREILGTRRTALLARGNIEFAKKLAHLIDDRKRREKLGSLMSARAVEYDAGKIASQYCEIYSATLG